MKDREREERERETEKELMFVCVMFRRAALGGGREEEQRHLGGQALSYFLF